MAKDTTLLPAGYKPIRDKTKLTGRLKTLSPSQEEIRRLMVLDRETDNKDSIERSTFPEIPKLKRLSDVISNNVQSQTDLRALTPYIKRAERIWLTLLLKPNGLDQERLEWDTLDSEIKNVALHLILLQRLKVYFTTTYPLENRLNDIVRDVMFRTGSYVLLDMSYPVLDHLINGMAVDGLESHRQEILDVERRVKQAHFIGDDFSKAKNTGWIRKGKSPNFTGFESIFSNTDHGEEFNLVHADFNWTFTDNPIVLKVFELRKAVIDDRLRKQGGFESIDTLVSSVAFETKNPNGKRPNNNNLNIADNKSYQEVIDTLYPKREYQQKDTLFVRRGIYYTGSGKGVGVTYHVPSEACIPVHINGEKRNPVGYILLVDPKTGEFLKTTGDINYYSSNKNRSEKLDNLPTAGSLNDVISNVKAIANGEDCKIDMDWAIDMVKGLLQKEIIESFLNGDKATPVTVSLTAENIKIFLSASLKQQGVRSVFVPAENITYFAIDYNEFGVGKSLVEEAKMAITRLAIFDIVDTVANIENAMSKTELSIDLEKENFNPTELINQVRENYLLSNPSILNFVGFANVSIDRVIDGIKESRVRIKVNANENPNIINPNIEERQEERVSVQPVDDASRDKAVNDLCGFFDLKRSWLVDTDQGNDFAIEALADQDLLMNTCLETSMIFSRFLSEHCSKHINCNEVLLMDLIAIIRENKKLYEKPDQGKSLEEVLKGDGETELSEAKKVSQVLKDFLNNLNIRLPTPAFVERYNKLTEKLEAADKLVNGWKELGIADKLLKRILTDMDLEQQGDENVGTNSEYVLAIIDSVLRRKAYRTLGISVPFDEIVADGREGGLLSFVTEAAQQRENVVTFVDELFKQLSKKDARIEKIGDKYRDGLTHKNEEDDMSEQAQDVAVEEVVDQEVVQEVADVEEVAEETSAEEVVEEASEEAEAAEETAEAEAEAEVAQEAAADDAEVAAAPAE